MQAGRHSPIKERIATDARICRPRPLSGRPSIRRRSSTRRQRSTRPGDLCSVLCSSIMCVCVCMVRVSTVHLPVQYATRRRSECPRIVWQPASHFLQGSSIVPERGKICPGARRSLLQIPRRPQVRRPRQMAFRYVDFCGHHLAPEKRSQKSNGLWAHETRRVRLYATRPWDDTIRGTEGLPS